MPRNVLLPCVISRRACDVATGEQLKDCGGEKNTSNLSHFSSSKGTLSPFKSSSLNPPRYCVTRAMKQLFSYKSIPVLRKPPSSIFLLLFCFFNHVHCQKQTTFVNRWGGLKCINYKRNRFSGHVFNSTESENVLIIFLAFFFVMQNYSTL